MLPKRLSAFKAPAPSEHALQVSVIQWWFYACHRWGLPFFSLFAIPNAGAGAQRGQAGKMKAEGTRRGIPDLMLAVPMGRAGGLFIEMKSAKGNLSPDQRLVIDYLKTQGYRVELCRTAEEAMAAIKRYLNGYALPPWLPGSADRAQ